MTTSGTKSYNEWCNKRQRVSTNDNEWQWMAKSSNKWQRVTTTDNKWQRLVILANFTFFSNKRGAYHYAP